MDAPLVQSLSTSQGPRRARRLWVTLAVIGTLAHLIACFETPRDSGDLGKRVLTAVMANAEGWHVLGRSVSDWAPALAQRVSWGEVPYNYPPLALAFFQVVAWLHPSLFAAKFALTLLEALNAVLIARFAKDRRAGIAYWCLPLSIWWVSHEGAMEPLQNLFVLLALLAWQQRRGFAPGALLLAVQVKLSAVFLAPWLFWTSPRPRKLTGWMKAGAFTAAALSPAIVASLCYPMAAQVGYIFHSTVKFNVYHWRAAFDASYHWWLPEIFVIWVQVASWATLLEIGRQMVRAPAPALLWTGAFLFLVAARFMTVFQPWYFLAFIPLWLPAVSARQRLAWFVLVQFCEPQSVWQLLFGPSGPMSPHGGLPLFLRLAHP